MICSNIVVACYVAEKSGLMPNLLKRDNGYFVFEFCDQYTNHDLYKLRGQIEGDKEFKNEYKKNLDIVLFYRLKEMLNDVRKDIKQTSGTKMSPLL